MSDLVSGRYGAIDPVWTMLGKPANKTQSDIPGRTNISWFGYGTPLDSATAATTKGVFSAVPVQWGDVIQFVTLLIGATAGKTALTSFVAVYSGISGKKEASLLAQSAKKEVEIVAKKPLTEELEKAILITPENAPGGWVYAGLTVEATTINTQIGTNAVAATQKEWFKEGPEAYAIEITQKEAGIAAAKTKTETAVPLVPYVVLQ